MISGDSYTDTGFNISGTAPGPDNHLGNPAWPVKAISYIYILSDLTEPLPQGKSVVNGLNWIADVTSVGSGLLYAYNFATNKAVVDKTITPSNGSSLVEQVQTFSKWNSGSSRPAWVSKSTVFSLWVGSHMSVRRHYPKF
jgi:hypothetical protein